MSKPTVLYKDLLHVVVGSSAFLTPIDHPATDRVSNTGPVQTSRVESYDKETGRIETRNTIYLPYVG